MGNLFKVIIYDLHFIAVSRYPRITSTQIVSPAGMGIRPQPHFLKLFIALLYLYAVLIILYKKSLIASRHRHGVKKTF